MLRIVILQKERKKERKKIAANFNLIRIRNYIGMLRMACTSNHFQFFSTQDREVKTEKDHDLMELKTKK